MSEGVLFLIGFAILGMAIAATLVATIAGDDRLDSSDDDGLKSEQTRPTSLTERPASGQRFNATALL